MDLHIEIQIKVYNRYSNKYRAVLVTPYDVHYSNWRDSEEMAVVSLMNKVSIREAYKVNRHLQPV